MGTMPSKRKAHFNEEHRRLLLQRSGVALIVSHGLEEEVEIVNDTFTRLFGYTMEDIPDVAHWWPLAYPDEAYREGVKAEWQTRVASAIANQNAIESMEAKVRCKDGSERYIEFHFASVGDANLVSFIDLTERKRAEIALRESEERFRLMADTAPVLIWMSGTDKLCTYFNKPWLDFTGRSMAQELGNGWVEGVHPDDLRLCVETYEQSFDRREKFSMEYRLRYYEGEYRWIFDIGAPRFNQDGSFAGYIGSCIDVTERKLAEEAIRVSEERLRLAQWAAHVGTFDLNLLTGVDVWQPETEALYGLPPGGFGRTLTAFEDLIHPNDRERIKELTREMMRTGQPTEAEWRVIWPDGTVHWIASRGQVFMNESGEPVRMLGVNMDITERKRADEMLSGMTRKLVEAQEQERARIGRELHDDINQRLGMLAIELGKLQDHPSEVISRAQELIERTSEIANDVQALSHELHASKLEYLGAVNGLKSWCKEFGQRQGLEIDFSSEVSRPLPLDIGTCLFRILQEALHNAVKHSGAKRIEVQLKGDSKEISLTVHDSGNGFDVTAAAQGRGLGLTSMKERIRLVNGSITIQSNRTVGTTIQVRVPFRSEHDLQRATR